MSFLHKIFFDRYYDVYYCSCIDDLKNNKCKAIKHTLINWYADPFLFVENNRPYIYCEVMNAFHSKGYIGLIELNDANKKINLTRVLDGKFHFSFPNFCKIGNKFYMIPECNENSTLSLYSSNEINGVYHLEKNLLEDVKYADSIIYKKYLFCYQPFEKQMYIYNFDLTSFEVKELLKKIDDSKLLNLRPAGQCNGNLFFFQNGYKTYGHYITAKIFDEQKLNFIDASNEILNEIDKFVKEKKYDGYHTLNFFGNSFVFDAHKEVFRPLKLFFWICRKLLRH